MNLPGFSVRNPVAVNLLMLGVVAAGLYALSTLVREFFPRVEPEQVFVSVPYPGATPEEIERTVARVVEREIRDVDGVEELRTTVTEGIAVIVAELEDGADRDRVLSDLRAEVDKARPDLPDGAEEPEIVEARPYIPVIAVVLFGDVDEASLHAVATRVEDDLLDLPGVTEVAVTGRRAREIKVEVEPARLDEHGLTLEQIGRTLAALNRDQPGGQLKGPERNVRVRTLGEAQRALALEALAVATTPGGRTVRLGEVARVADAFVEGSERGRFRGRRAVSITVFKTPEQDAIAIATAVKAYVARHPRHLGGAVRAETTTDLARFIEQRLDLMTRNALAGLALVLLTLAVFLELRVALWVAAGLGVAFLGTFAAMAAAGLTINLISLFGLIVVLGLLVDDAIVIGENIFRKRREGLPPLAAAEAGAREVTLPVLAAVSTTIAAFLPLLFMAGRMGQFLGVLPQVVTAALLVSLVEALLILPSHLAHRPARARVAGGLARALERLSEARHRLFEERLPGILERHLRFLLRWRYPFLAAALAGLLLCAGLVAGGLVPFVLLQQSDAEALSARLEMSAGTPEEETVRALARIEEAALAQPEVASVFSVLGASYGDRGRQEASDPAIVGQVVIELVPADRREALGQRVSQAVIEELRARTARLPGVRRLSFGAQGGAPTGPAIEVRLRAEDLGRLAAAVDAVGTHLGGYAGVTELYDDLELGKLEVRLALREDARLLGLTTQDLASQVRHALYGYEAQRLQIGNEEVKVRLLLPAAGRRVMGDLARFQVQLPGGGRAPLGEVAHLDADRGYASILRVDGRRAATLVADVDERVGNVSEITRAATAALADVPTRFPGVSFTFEGRQKETRESVGSLVWLFPAALLLIYALIAVLFRSYVQPVIVMSVIPFALGGAVVGHWVTGYPFTILSMIGAVALAGIVVNDGLILVDLANRRRREGLPLVEAVVAAARGRMRAILLTSITTCAGLAPLMLETSFQARFLIPMAVAIVFGLLAATVLVLVLLPALFLVLEDLRGGARWLLTGTFTRRLAYDPAVHGEAAGPGGDGGAGPGAAPPPTS